MRDGRRCRTAGVLAVVAAVAAAPLSMAPAGAQERGPAPDAPQVLPALQEWKAGSGEYRFGAGTRIVLDEADARTAADARELAGELREVTGRAPRVVHDSPDRHGDIVLSRSAHRKGELKSEGYHLDSGDRLTVTGATSTGIYYGTRTVLQLLRGQGTAPGGSATDVPEYRERGVGVCACYIHISMEYFERLMRDMASQKLNQLWIEAKVKSDVDPKSAFWGYYTKDEVRQLVKMAERYHIELIPEINSPGHMDTYLENHPELQLKDKDGKASPPRLDITRSEAFTYYTSLVDEALDVWDARTWHMGADEYMIGTAYPDFPHIQEYATEKFGEQATPDDAFVDFVNRVGAHVRADGRPLRIWNDGLLGRNHLVPLDRDIAVEHWLGGDDLQKPSSLLAEGWPVMNSSYSLYLVRGGFTMKTKDLYESGWSPLAFEDEELTSRPANLTGAKITLWPDNAAEETENEVEAKAFMPLRFIAQATWGGPRPAATYQEFEELARGVGHAPGWDDTDREPLDADTYRLVGVGTGGHELAPAGQQPGALTGFAAGRTGAWRATTTPDGYYTLRSAETGLCLDVNRGKRYLGAPLEDGAEITQETCAAGKRTQRWQVAAHHGSLKLVNAISQLQLTSRASDGTATQTAPDRVGATYVRAVPER
ncbi:Beta-N-acetylhexosaminidase precursor [Streptomyces sp. YIM 130001]|uniref:family 20 glycosylhydrolase n=1 Tax=Streptomyces sp. YIM 130001 TaxID=2259644 RepID=UPI000E655821|nr:family 20 glycosylhydrolase [Streptomyces sp. YIM 130001]RII17867.1 Beta-N-acetylhexosaminidase precursor [Streptomyces sp. YIM 130001]